VVYTSCMVTVPDTSTAQAVAYNWLRRFIQGIPPNETALIIETDVAEAAQVSRTPVREALTRLTAEGLVVRAPYKGVYVPEMRSEEIDWLFESRAMIESHSSRVTAQNSAVITQMLQLIERQTTAKTDLSAFLEFDFDFHCAPVRAAGNLFNYNFYRTLQAPQQRLGHIAVHRTAARLAEVLQEHRAIVEAISGGDQASIEQSIAVHLEHTASAVRKSFRVGMLPA
jgi:DNA-binding GntR family transcriptional regulator